MYVVLRGNRKGFALPTVLIASVVLLTVLAVSVSATAAVRTTLKNQYYAQLAQMAGEAGVAYAKACLASNGNVPQWSDASPLKPNTDCAGNSNLSTAVNALVVAGGGGGGSGAASAANGGGGGGGGVVTSSSYGVSPQTYPIVVGAGGAVNVTGSNSSFGSLVALGGGKGGGLAALTPGAAGGSGGGGSSSTSGAATGGASSAPSQGFAGGGGVAGSPYRGGGGGGAAEVGSTDGPGYGGDGIPSSITGVPLFYGGGGGAGADTGPGLGGDGGGGNGVVYNGGIPGVPGTANTGGGGGGGASQGVTIPGGAGGSGVVVIAYPTGSLTATGGTITTSGSNTIHRFTSSANFVVTAIGTASCPTDPRCSVTVNGNIRSSFSIGAPTVDADGKALTIPNNGFVEIIRTSNGTVWRTISQPKVQAAVVPDLCSGAASSIQGWGNAVRATTQDTFSPSPTAQSITLANTTLNAGQIYFRKDFTVTTAGTYNVSALGPSSADSATVYIDGKIITSTAGALATQSTTLAVGCHHILVKLNNITTDARATRFTAAVYKDANTLPVAATDSSWRVTTGSTVGYAHPDFYADPASWTIVLDRGALNAVYPNWGVYGDPDIRYIYPSHSYDVSLNSPSASYIAFRDSRTVTVSAPTDVRVLYQCDDVCTVFMDGNVVAANASAVTATTGSQTITLSEGAHQFGMSLYNISGAAWTAMSVIRVSDGVVLTRTDASWRSQSAWSTAGPQAPYSYSASFRPNPDTEPSATVEALVVGGGGGGGSNHAGGGGAGGVVYGSALAVRPQSYAVTVGAGGAGGTATGNAGIFGVSSIFGGLVALGGGGGGGRVANNSVTQARLGSSGGGGAGTLDGTTGHAGYGAAGTAGQGNSGGNGTSDVTAGNGGGGGGAGAAGGNSTGAGGASVGVSGAGGNGLAYSITGSSVYYGGGGSGGRWGAGTIGAVGLGGGGAGGAASGVGGAGVANTGGGGGGGGDNVAVGGAGGSGVVIIRYPTGTMTATGGTITTSGGYTIHRFTTSGIFTVTSIP